jgi:DNA-binding NtrC family response regulator
VAQVLIVEQDPAKRASMVAALVGQGHRAVATADPAAALLSIEGGSFDALVTDLELSGDDGLRLCRGALARDPELPVIVVTSHGSLESAIAAIRAGAYDYLTEPFPPDALALAVGRAATLRSLRRDLGALRSQVPPGAGRSRLEGASAAVCRLREAIARVAATSATVLIRGESGVGKELVARELHALSPRARAPFVAENVAAIPHDLLESTLFGHARGAFTSATGDRKGLFRQADGGTLLLDEIAELPLDLQPKLLRALEERSVRPVGSDHTAPVDVRFIAASHDDLEVAVRRGRFREDLYYRLAVLEVEVPPLRDRGGDILVLATRFLAEACGRAHVDPPALHPSTAERLLRYRWPGNVRELRNAMERAAILSHDGLVRPSDLPARIADLPADPPAPEAGALLSVAEVERRHILHVLNAVGGNRSEAARVLRIGRRTLYRKLEAWGGEMGQNDT